MLDYVFQHKLTVSEKPYFPKTHKKEREHPHNQCKWPLFCWIGENRGRDSVHFAGFGKPKDIKKSSQRLANYLIFSGPTWA